MKRIGLVLVLLMVGGMSVLGEEFDIVFVGTVQNVTDCVTVRIDEVLATAAKDICDTVDIEGDFMGIEIGDRLHVKGFYDPVDCVVSIEDEEHFVYRLPPGAELEKLPQSIQFTGEILRIYEMKGEIFCEISAVEVFVVTYQEKEMCQTVTVKINPVVGEVEEGLLPGDEVEFSGTYDEKSCMGSLGWHDDYLRKKRSTGGSWVLVVGGFVAYLVLRKVW